MQVVADYIAELDALEAKIQATTGFVNKAALAVGTVKETQDYITYMARDAEKLEGFAADIDLVVKLVSQFGPLKAVVKPLKGLSKQLHDRLKQFEKQAEDMDEFSTPFQSVIGLMAKALKAAKFGLWDAQTDINGVREALNEANVALDMDLSKLPEVLGDTVDLVVCSVGTLDDMRSDLAEVNAKIDTIFDGAKLVAEQIDTLAGYTKAVATMRNALDKLLEPLEKLEAPLSIIGDVLSPLEWVLDAADYVFDLFVSPILDPILQATGIQDLISDLAQPIRDLLPDINLLTPYVDITDKLEAIFGGIDIDTPGIFTGADVALSELKDLIVSFGDLGIVGGLLKGGDATNDFLLAINNALNDSTELDGQGGHDIIAAGSGDDTLIGGAGNDILIAGDGDDTVIGGGDVDALIFHGYFGEFGFETVDGSVTQEITFDHRGGASTFGRELVHGVEYFAFLDETFTYDFLKTAIRVDYTTVPPTTSITGTSGGEIMIGAERADTIMARGGNDYILGYAGFDFIDGGAGKDTISYSGEFLEFTSVTGAVVVLDAGGPATLYAQRSDNLVNIENVTGSSKSDILVGSAAANVLKGSGGTDLISGGGGRDRLYGGAAVDTITGGNGNDTLYGGLEIDLLVASAGNDTYSVEVTNGAGDLDYDLVLYGAEYSAFLGKDVTGVYTDMAVLDPNLLGNLPHHIRVDMEAGTVFKLDNTGTLLGQDTLAGAVNILGTDRADVLLGGPQRSVLDGGAGNDILKGFVPTKASDALTFLSDGETVGARQATTLIGGLGDDTLSTVSGDDLLIGGEGDDVFKIITDTSLNAPENKLESIFNTDGTSRYNQGGGIFGGSTPDDLVITDPYPVSRIPFKSLDFSTVVDDGHDILDLSKNENNWVIYLNNNYMSSHNILPRTVTADLSIFTYDTIAINGIDEIIGGDAALEIWASYDREVTIHGSTANDLLLSYSQESTTLYGGLGNDEVTGGSAVDRLYGGGGDDYVFDPGGTHGLRDIIDLGAGDDTFLAGAGNLYSIDGGAGTDRADFTRYTTAINIDLGAETGMAYGETFILKGIEAIGGTDLGDTLYGNNGVNELIGEDGNDTLYGLKGNDVLYGGTGNDLVFGGLGDDILRGDHGNTTLDGGKGFDTLNVSFEVQYYSSGSRSFYRSDQEGTWEIDLKSGTALRSGGTEAANFILKNIEAVEGGGFADTIIGNNKNNLLSGQDGDDLLKGAGGQDVLSGGAGNDIIYGGGGNDKISGNEGQNTIYGGKGNDLIIDNSKGDSVELISLNPQGTTATGEHLRLEGFAEMPTTRLTIEMVVKADPQETGKVHTFLSYAVAGSFNELVIMTSNAASPDIMIGINGVFFNTGLSVEYFLADGAAHRLSLTVDTVAQKLELYIDGERLFTLQNDPSIHALVAGGAMIIGQEQDSLGGGFDADQQLVGSVGDIRLFDHVRTADEIANNAARPLDKPAGETGLLANWQIDPNTGAPIEVLGGRNLTPVSADSERSSTLGDQIFGGTGNDQVHAGIGGDLVKGGSGKDMLYGEKGLDNLQGQKGSDRLFGGDHNDAVYGGSGNDQLYGGKDDDTLFGGTGNDKIYGGQGKDVMYGDAGADVFFYQDAAHAANDAGEQDYIILFTSGEDTIDLSAIDANINTKANNAFVFMGAGAFSGTAGELRLHTRADGYFNLKGDLDGDGKADFKILLDSIITNGDFVL